ncbi:MAG: tail-specific protease, partial [Bdellovibrionota bacterium]
MKIIQVGSFKFILALGLLVAPQAHAATLACPALDKIEQVFLNSHISFKEATPDLEARTISQYIKRLDSAKIYLTEADVADITKQMKGVFAKLRTGECATL